MSKPDNKNTPNPLIRRIALSLACLLLVASAGAWWYVQNSAPQPQLAPRPQPQQSKPAAPAKVETPASFVAEQQCQGCHQDQFKDWQRSHHQKAMQGATADT